MSRDVHLHSRDVEVLELLADRRVETLNALHRKLWPTSTRKSAYNRLGQLARAGYLEHLIRADPVPRPSVERRPTQHLYVLGPRAPAALRIRARTSRKIARLPAAFIDHQLATNRVGDWLGTRLMGEVEASQSLPSRYRPDAAYYASVDDEGRDLVLLEIDLGHYSRARVLQKFAGFNQHPDARAIVFVSNTTTRARCVARWIRERYGPCVADDWQVFTFDEVRSGARFHPGLEPVMKQDESLDWYADVLGEPGCK